MLEPQAGPIEEINDKNCFPPYTQGAKKFSFIARHLGKLQLATSMYQPNKHFNYPEKIFAEQDWLQFFSKMNFPLQKN